MCVNPCILRPDMRYNFIETKKIIFVPLLAPKILRGISSTSIFRSFHMCAETPQFKLTF
ncbi:hypothetical protein Plhal304r1_c012g0045851 [Plasmopara halstedii]